MGDHVDFQECCPDRQVAACLVAAGCSGGGDGVPLPEGLAPEKGKPSLSDPAKNPDPSASKEHRMGDQIRYRLENEVLQQSALDRPISATCTPTGNKQYECTVTYAGQPIRHKVQVTKESAALITFVVPERDVVVTSRGVQLAMLKAVQEAGARGQKYSDVRCAADLPEVQVVPKNTRLDEKPACSVKKDGALGGRENFFVTAMDSGVSVFHK
ncbi:hypothetical protein GCM10027418_15780 [Mariniluteicoccus endophyticus]